MTQHKNKHLLLLLFIALMFSACKKQWDQRDKVTDQQLNINLMQQIQANSSLSTFAGYITKVGYDKLLISTKTYTVWAPTNAALQGLDPAIIADTTKLKQFVGNHIANQAYLTTNVQTSLRLHNLIGKNLTFTPTTVEDANVTAGNQYVNNGVLHIIDKPLIPKMNISEYIRSLTTVGLLQKAYVLRNDTTFIDTTKATVASIDPKTGKPVLVPNTGLIMINKYFNKVGNLASEDSLYTYFVLTDDAYTAERNKVSKYFATVTNSADTTMNILAGFNVLKDVVVRGAVAPANLLASLTSVNGVPIPINKSAIVQTYNASNGIVYVMSSINFNVSDKITPITIQGELPTFFARTDQTSKIAYRAKSDANNVRFNDLFVTGAGLPASFFAAYKLSNLYTCQYKVVWRAVNDTSQTHTIISQRLTFGSSAAAAVPVVSGTVTPVTIVNFPYININPYNYNEVQLTGATGTTTTTNTTINVVNATLNVLKYRSVNMYVQGAATTATNTNDVLIDYVKLIPILQ